MTGKGIGVLLFGAVAGLVVSLPAKKAGNEIPFEADGGTVLQDPELCANQFCHSTFRGSTLNAEGSSVLFQNLPEVYFPGQSYEIGLSITGEVFLPPGKEPVFGFQLAAVFADQKQAGMLEGLSPGSTTVLAGDVLFLTHQEALPSGDVSFRWTAPPVGGGPVTFRVAANAGNNNEMESGDAISTNQVVVPQGESESVVSYFAQIGVGSDGPATFETDLIFLNTGAASLVSTEIFRSSGEPMAVRIEPSQGDPVVGESFQMVLEKGASRELGLRGLDQISPGYVRVTAGPGVGGVAVFSFLVDPGGGAAPQTLYDSGVPTSSPVQDFSLSVQVSEVSDTGLAIVNVTGIQGQGNSSGPNGVHLSLYDGDFELVETADLTLEPGEHRARFVSELFPVLGVPGTSFRGSLTVSSDQPLAAVTLRQTRVPTLTALPVLPGRADQEPE